MSRDELCYEMLFLTIKDLMNELYTVTEIKLKYHFGCLSKP
jgi:hypothetical protein